jgi:diketogulonate reductase-like aldo/keto reductase
MEELWALRGGAETAVNQVLYNLTRRGIEADLMPWSEAHRVQIMAYSPVEEGKLARERKLRPIAERHGITTAQVALAWVLQRDSVIAIPKAVDPAHVRENRAALDLRLTAADLAEIDRLYPPPKKPVPLEMI